MYIIIKKYIAFTLKNSLFICIKPETTCIRNLNKIDTYNNNNKLITKFLALILYISIIFFNMK